jgi:multicomponent Na+:H+ antiporter subunit E
MRQPQTKWGNALRRLLPALLLAALLWWVLYEGELGGPVIAAVAIGAATVASLLLLPVRAWKVSLPALVRFVPFFLLESGRGSVDVARRAFAPHIMLKPGFIERVVTLEAGAPRLFFAGVIGLFPGTLSVELIEPEEGPARLRVHVLDLDASPDEKLSELEQKIGPIFLRRD